MVTVADILEVLEVLAPASLAEEWDNPGLQVGRRSRPVSSVGVSLEAGTSQIDWAVGRGIGLLVTHHPLIFTAVRLIDTDEPAGRRIARALAGDLAVAALHTNLDAAPGGLADDVAGRLGLARVIPLAPPPGPAPAGAGIGRAGETDLFPDDFLEVVRRAFGMASLRTAGQRPNRVTRVAVVPGSGGRHVVDARRAGATVLVTGEASYHQALQAVELGLWVIEAGHDVSEAPAVPLMAEYLRRAAADRSWPLDVSVFPGEHPVWTPA